MRKSPRTDPSERNQQDEPVRQCRWSEPCGGYTKPLHHLLNPRKLWDRAGNNEPVRRTPPARQTRSNCQAARTASTQRMARRCSQAVRPQYIKGARDRLELKSFARAMTSQRRRLFFQLSETAARDLGSHWMLTVFHNAGDYLEFRKAVKDGAPRDLVARGHASYRKGIQPSPNRNDDRRHGNTMARWHSRKVGRSDGKSIHD